MEDIIKNRHSVRVFKRLEVNQEDIEQIIMAGIMAPSAENRQPWRFRVLNKKKDIEEITSNMKKNKWIMQAPVIIAVYMTETENDIRKDFMATGACIENMLLKACQLGLGACWLGENLLFDKIKIKEDNKLQCLAALIALGYERNQAFSARTSRESLCHYMI